MRAQLAAVLPEGTTPVTLGDAGAWERRLADTQPALRDALYALLSDAAALGADTGRQQVEALLGVRDAGDAHKAIADPPAVDLSAVAGVDWTLVNADALDWARQYAGTLIGQITDTTLRTVRAAVAEWVQNGLPLDALAAELAPVFGEERARRIAETEVTRAFAAGNVRSWRASGVVQRMEWRTARDERVCPVCAPLNGTTAPVAQGFAPNPPAHVRCRCWLVPVVG